MANKTEHEHAPVGTMDLNNPPQEPYTGEPYPKMLYDWRAQGTDSYVVVKDAAEEKTYTDKGWKEKPPPTEDQKEAAKDEAKDDWKAQHTPQPKAAPGKEK